MNIKKIRLISFSPTRTSKSVIDAIASGIQHIPCETIDLTYPDAVSEIPLAADELVILGVPVYAGRVAPLAVQRLASIEGNNTPAVIVVTYGNREFEDALIELRDLAEKAGLKPMAACSFIGEHSFSGSEMPIAADRPDPVDLATAKAFGARISEKLAAVSDLKTAQSLKVPGNFPYKEGMGSMPFTPTVIHSECTQCAACIPVCPAGAISLETAIEIDQHLCIFCCACVKNCPEAAIKIDADPIMQKRQWLHEHCAERKEPELYL
jgi:ferredoxin